MVIKTGYFAKIKQYEAYGYKPVCISRTCPSWCTCVHLPVVAPSWSILNEYKKGLITTDMYRTSYLDELRCEDLDLFLDILSHIGDKVVLCCYEAPDKFCHRHILAEELNSRYGFNIQEF